MPDVPLLPADVIREFRDVIEFGDDAISRVVAELLRKLQVQSVRINALPHELVDPDKAITVNYVENCVSDIAGVYARTAALFDYARGKTDTVPVPGDPPPQDMFSSLRQLGFHEVEFPRIHDRV